MPFVNNEFLPLEVPGKIGRVLFDNTKKWRYRALYGGRGAGKDWSAKAAICEMAIRKPMRILFARELQNSIKDSSHRLIADTIQRLGLNQFYNVLDNEIRGTNGALFIFRGIRHNTDEIKSMEGIDLCVLDEARPLTEESFLVLDPTIRRAGSEILFLFNVLMESDFVYQFCVKNPPENLIGSLVNYTDNPYCPAELIEQADRMKVENIERYKNIWLGEPLTLGLFFSEFGLHNKERPFIISDHETSKQLIGSLDHGLAHCTSFGLHYLDNDGQVHRIFTYCNNGGTTQSHAEAIADAIEGCQWSRYTFPSEIFYDYAMDEKHAINERIYISDLDIYKAVFSKRRGGNEVKFIPANKRKVDGCHAMKAMFAKVNGLPILRYFDGLNNEFVESIKNAITDKVNTEVYAKMDGDDPCDEFRYAAMGIMTRLMQQKSRQAYQAGSQYEKVASLKSQMQPLFFSIKKKA